LEEWAMTLGPSPHPTEWLQQPTNGVGIHGPAPNTSKLHEQTTINETGVGWASPWGTDPTHVKKKH